MALHPQIAMSVGGGLSGPAEQTVMRAAHRYFSTVSAIVNRDTSGVEPGKMIQRRVAIAVKTLTMVCLGVEAEAVLGDEARAVEIGMEAIAGCATGAAMGMAVDDGEPEFIEMILDAYCLAFRETVKALVLMRAGGGGHG